MAVVEVAGLGRMGRVAEVVMVVAERQEVEAEVQELEGGTTFVTDLETEIPAMARRRSAVKDPVPVERESGCGAIAAWGLIRIILILILTLTRGTLALVTLAARATSTHATALPRLAVDALVLARARRRCATFVMRPCCVTRNSCGVVRRGTGRRDWAWAWE